MTSEIVYTGELRNVLTHLKSGSTIITDAPTDNKGKGEAFSPTDLLATSAGACALTIIGITAHTHQFNIDGTRVEVKKVMAEYPRRVAEIHMIFHLPANNFSEKERHIIERSAKTCPVVLSIHSDIKTQFIFRYQ